MDVSIIIPTYNRGRQILNLLDALQGQSFADFEVVIINDGSTDDTVNVVESKIANYRFPIVIKSFQNRGRAVSRNRGAALAKGKLLIFYDDDVRPNKRSVEFHINFHRTHPNCILDGPALYDQSVCSGDFFAYRKKREEAWYLKVNEPVKKEVPGLTGANKSISKDLFFALGGLDEQLTDSEDFEFAYRAFKRGVSIYQDYKTWVFHDDFQSLEGYIRRRKEANASSRRLLSLNPDIHKYFYNDKFVFKTHNWFIVLATVFVESNYVIKLCCSKFFRMLPTIIRYKVYEIICLRYSYLKIAFK